MAPAVFFSMEGFYNQPTVKRCELVKLVPVSQATYANKVWRRAANFSFAAKESIVPILAAECGSVAPWMPIVFMDQGGVILPAAMMSPIAGRNLFIGSQGQWLGGYVPSVLRSYPFCRGRLEGRQETIVCFDEDSGLLDGEGGEQFFAPGGEPSPALRAVLNLLEAVNAAQAPTELAMASIREAEITEPWLLRVKVGSAERAIEGLLRIRESALRALDDAAFLKLRKTGGLEVAYLQLVSMGQTARFDTLFRLLYEPDLTAAAALKSCESLDELFGMATGDTIKFN